jgi:hypothetical protein
MDGLGPRLFGHRHNAVDIQISGYGAFSLAHHVGFIGFESVNAEAIFLCVDRHGSEAKVGGRPEYPDGDFGPISGQNL